MAEATPKLYIAKRAPDGTFEIPIMGEFGFEVLANWILQDLMNYRPTAVKFIVYSPGGAVFDALAIYGYMKANGIKSYTEVYGYAASAATVLAAHSGPKNTSMAPGSMFMIHNSSGPDEKIVADVNKQLAGIYSEAYGWSEKEASKLMSAGEGMGTTWFAADAKKAGICSEVMADVKVAAHANINTTAMAENKKTMTVQAKVKLTTMDAARAAFSAEGTTAEVEVDIEQATAEALAAKDAEIAEKDQRIAELEKEKVDGAAQAEALTSAQEEAVTAKAALDTAKADHEKALSDLKAAHATEIEKLKKPKAERVVPDNKASGIGAMPNSEMSESDKAALHFRNNANALDSGLTMKKENA